MHRSEFLSDSAVQQFIPWLRQRFNGNFCHAYIDRQSGQRWRCESLHEAFQSYEWNGKDWPANKRELDAFREQLRSAVRAHDEDAVFSACEAILRWGGVWANNGVYLEKRRGSMLAELRHLGQILEAKEEPSAASLRRVPSEPTSDCRMNAGFVKIYSVLLEHFVIYDGRVGAALGLLVRRFCEETGCERVPEALRFAYGSPKEGANPARPKTRNPSSGAFVFPRLRPNSRFHSAQAMRASWLLKAGLESNRSPFSEAEEGFHELAAGLFMVGYDLGNGLGTGVAGQIAG